MKDQSKTKQPLMKKKASLDKASEYAESIINAICEPLIILDQDLRVVTASRSFYEFFKVKPEETEGQLIYNLGNDQWDIPRLRELLETILPQKTTFDNYEVEHDFATIGKRIMLLNARQIKRALGKERIILLAIEDITERKQLESLLIDSEEQYRRLFETASDGIVLLEKSEGKITQANPATEKLLGYSEKESVGNKLQDIGVLLDENDFRTTMQNLNKSGIINYRNVKVETKSGQNVDTEIYLVDRAKLVQCNIRDITEHKQAENMLRQQTDAMNSAIDGMAILNEDGKYVYLNKAHANIYGYENEAELLGKSWRIFYDSEVIQRFEQDFMPELSRKGYWSGEVIGTKKNGSKFPQSLSLTAMANGGLICVVRDVTEGRRQEEELRRMNVFLNSIVENIPNMIFLKDARDLRFIRFNRAGEDLLGYSSDDLLGKSDYDLFPKEQADHFTKKDRDVLNGKEVLDIPEESIQTRTKGERTVHTKKVPLLNEKGEPEFLLGISEDITERKQVEDELKESENKYRLLADNVDDVIFVLDMNLRFTYVSPSVKTLMGYEREELLTLLASEMMTPSSLDLAVKTLSEIMELEKAGNREIFQFQILQLELRRKDGSTVWTEVKASFVRDENQRPVGIIGVGRDITERRKAEQALLDSEAIYRLVVENINDIIWTFDLSSMSYTFVSPSAQRILGYSNETLLKNLDLIFTPETKRNVLARFEKFIKDKPERNSLVFDAEHRKKDGSLIWMEISASPLNDVLGNIVGFLGVTRNITERMQADQELQKTLESLRKAVSATVQVMVSAVEMRDPYTAGHQLRVADLARTIATEMGLPQDKIEGIRMAGSIHDIGKLSIPAEILSRPAKLTNIEFSLIKEHSQSGYEMLKNVDSPWPLAQIVYQHHERMNGTGYPRNLKGDEILMEARIMAVADVVEAMASHRPYRAALGIEVALEEIEKNKGIIYDADVADACLKLFREKGYQFK
jgi:PAS domain S-box-containing protein